MIQIVYTCVNFQYIGLWLIWKTIDGVYEMEFAIHGHPIKHNIHQLVQHITSFWYIVQHLHPNFFQYSI